LILYLDTSVLVKLIHSEAGSDSIRAAASQAKALASSTLAKVEVHSALARLAREGVPGEVLARRFSAFSALWERMARVSMDRAADAAAGLCLKHPLRALDALHLASALLLRTEGGLEVVFGSADARLKDAAGKEGFQIAG
jgi:predicted nucleic acid-binding protein